MSVATFAFSLCLAAATAASTTIGIQGSEGEEALNNNMIGQLIFWGVVGGVALALGVWMCSRCKKGGPNQWSTQTCDCCADCPGCCAVCWCTPITIPQLCTRYLSTPSQANPTYLCFGLALFLFFAITPIGPYIVFSATLASFSDSMTENVNNPAAAMADFMNLMNTNQLFGFIFFLAGLIPCIVTCQVRAKIRARDGIAPDNCGGCEDCCCACFCGWCTQCMILRHDGNVTSTGAYNLFGPLPTEPTAVAAATVVPGKVMV